MCVALGVTFAVPESPGFVTPVSILTEVAFVVDQVRTEVPPEAMLAGAAENWIVGAPEEDETVTVTFEVALPPGPVAVIT